MKIAIIVIIVTFFIPMYAQAFHEDRRTCLSSHEKMIEHMINDHAQVLIWSGKGITNIVLFIYLDTSTGVWTSTAQETNEGYECTFSIGVEGQVFPIGDYL